MTNGKYHVLCVTVTFTTYQTVTTTHHHPHTKKLYYLDLDVIQPVEESVLILI